jgi:cysteinyl-tRNA synthetase
MGKFVSLSLYNTLSREKEPFKPLDRENVRMYVCGPTVYDDAHIGNARPIIVFDVLFRLLRHIYGAAHVAYARNITDVDDKINARAAEESTTIAELTTRTTARFHADIAELGVLEPGVEPRATEHIDEMRVMIETLIAKGHAYVAEDHVLFHVPSMATYGRLSRRSLDDMRAGARVEVAPYKRDPMDFVLWKPSADDEPGWPSPGGIEVEGRPGWHIECSAMSEKHLGQTFDIHGGGIDLEFPHHENELAQSCCAHGTEMMAQVWMHNGFLQVEGQKMSKSLGNFVTIGELLRGDKIGGRSWDGEVLRLAMLRTHYRQPIDWTLKGLQESERILQRWYEAIGDVAPASAPHARVMAALEDDLNTPRAIAELFALATPATGEADPAARNDAQRNLKASANLMGLLYSTNSQKAAARRSHSGVDEDAINALIAQRLEARTAKDFATADRIRDELEAMGVALKDGPDGTTWEVRR